MTFLHTDERNHRTAKTDYLPASPFQSLPQASHGFQQSQPKISGKIWTPNKENNFFQTKKRITPLRYPLAMLSNERIIHLIISPCFIISQWPVFLDLHNLLRFPFWFCLASKVTNALLHENIQYPAKCATWGEFYPLFLDPHLSLHHHHHLKPNHDTHTKLLKKTPHQIWRPDLIYNLTTFKM